jgi:hypothetical protein
MGLAHSNYRSKDRYTAIFGGLLVLLIACSSLLGGCATAQSTNQTNSKSVIEEPSSDREVHGEVGVMYGASAR